MDDDGTKVEKRCIFALIGNSDNEHAAQVTKQDTDAQANQKRRNAVVNSNAIVLQLNANIFDEP